MTALGGIATSGRRAVASGAGQFALAMLLAVPRPAMAGDLTETLPSGLEVTYQDLFVEAQDDGELWLTMRYLAPGIGQDPGEFGYDQVSADLDLLCDSEGLPAAQAAGGIDQIVITLMDRVVERGVIDPAATMFIGAYLATEEGCVWQ